MTWTSLVAAACLLGQLPGEPPFVPGGSPAAIDSGAFQPNRTAEAPASDTTVPVQGRDPKSATGELLAAMLTLPEDLALPGKGVALVDVLQSVAGRQQQLEATQAYWKLTASLANMNNGYQEVRFLTALESLVAANQPRQGHSLAPLELQTRRAAAAARMTECELLLRDARYDLVAKAQLPDGDDQLPLPADRPHTGAYKTQFDHIYAGRAPSPRARLIDRTLPARLAALEAHAAAVQASYDLLDTAQDAYGRGEISLATIFACLDDLTREQRTFVTQVVQYNNDIATYALAIPPEGTSSTSLVTMLIKTSRTQPSQPASGDSSFVSPAGGVTPAAFQEPARSGPTSAVPATGSTPPASPHTEPARTFGEPTLAPPKPSAPPEAPAAPSSPRRIEPFEGGGRGPQANAADGPALVAHEALRPSGEQPGNYSALAELTPARRAQELAELMHWDRVLADDPSPRLTLEDCLARATTGDRSALLAAYWTARQHMAAHQLVAEQAAQLKALEPTVFALRSRPAGAEAMVRLRAAQLSVEAARLTARAELLVDQWWLAQHAGQSLDGAWPLPSTTPHGGGYQLRAEAQATAVTRSASLRRAVAAVPAWHRSLQERAAAVISADATRARAMGQFESGQTDLEAPLEAIEWQVAHSQAFLAALTSYNEEIADYALAVTPSATSGKALAGMLVLAPGEVRR